MLDRSMSGTENLLLSKLYNGDDGNAVKGLVEERILDDDGAKPWTLWMVPEPTSNTAPIKGEGAVFIVNERGKAAAAAKTQYVDEKKIRKTCENPSLLYHSQYSNLLQFSSSASIPGGMVDGTRYRIFGVTVVLNRVVIPIVRSVHSTTGNIGIYQYSSTIVEKLPVATLY